MKSLAEIERLCFLYFRDDRGLDLIGVASSGEHSIVTWKNPGNGCYGITLVDCIGESVNVVREVGNGLSYIMSCSKVMQLISESAKSNITEIKRRIGNV